MLADKFGKHKVLYIVAPISIIPIFLITNLTQIPLALVLVVSTSFFILISGRYVPVMSIITSSVNNEKRGSFMLINSSFQQMSMGLASLIAGLVISYGNDGKMVGFNILGYLSIFMTFIFIYLSSKVKIVD
jgi:MFS family permease